MKLKIRIDDEETRALWETAKRAKAEVDSWPAWKRGELVPRPPADAAPDSAPVAESSDELPASVTADQEA
ncbi:MAG: hypothetical protein E6J91_15450 [Deltaproteobacteria bacterium]|nr:MAG: hypothetical protein E6J91_15450 [Deltaproteobacteria bacterium]